MTVPPYQGPPQPPRPPGPPPSWSPQMPAQPAPGRSKRGLVIGLVAAAAVLVLCCLPVAGFGAYSLIARSADDEPRTEPVLPTWTTASAPSAPSGAPSASTAAQCAWSARPAAPDTKDVGTPPATVATAGKPVMTLVTNLGTITIALDRAATPCTVASFAHLAGKGYFAGTSCHRLTTDGIFVLQCGDPSGTGRGGPAYQFPDENLANIVTPYPRGNVAMANAGPGTNGSQFFLNYNASPLPKSYTQFGTVTSGMEIIDRVVAGGVNAAGANGPGDGRPNTPLTFTSVTVA